MEDEQKNDIPNVEALEQQDVPQVAEMDNPLLAAESRKGFVPKYIYVLLIPILVALGAVYVVPLFIDWENERAQIIKNVEDITGRKLTIDGQIEFTAFPDPSFTIKNVRLSNSEDASTQYILQVETITARPSLISLLFGKIKIKSLNLGNAVIDLENFAGKTPNWNFRENRPDSEITVQDKALENYVDVENITINSAQVFFRSGDEKAPTERILPIKNAVIESDSLNGPFKISGDLKAVTDNLDARFRLETGDLSGNAPAEFVFNFYTGGSAFSFDGAMKNWTTTPSVSGKVKASIDKSIESFSDYFGIDETILPSSLSSIFSTAKTEIGGDFHLSSKGLEISELSINAVNTKGKGSFAVTFEKVTQVNLNLEFEYLDLEPLLDAPSVPKISTGKEQELINDFASGAIRSPSFDLAESLKLILDLKVIRAKFNGHEISNLNVKAEMGQGATIIRNLTASNLPGNTELNMSGILDKDEFVSGQKFKSTIRAQGDDLGALLQWVNLTFSDISTESLKEFTLDGNISFAPDKITVSRIFINVDDLDILGQAVIKYSEKPGEKPTVNSAFQITKLDLDKYLADNDRPITDIAHLSDFDELQDVRKIDAIRNLDLYFKTVGFRLVIKDILFGGSKYKNFNTTMIIKPGLVDISEIKFENVEDGGKFKGSVKIDAQALRPKIEVVINAKNFALGAPAPDADLSRNAGFSEKRFSFRRFGLFDGTFKMKFKNLQLGRVKLTNVNISGEVDADSIDFKTFRAKIGGGHIDVKAVLGIRRSSASASLSIKNAGLDIMAKDWFGMDVLERGRISTTGTISTTGHTIKSWIENLEGALSISSRGLIFKGFNLYEIANRVSSFAAIDKLRSFVHKALSEGTSEIDYMAGNAYIQRGVLAFRRLTMTHALIKSAFLSAEIDMPKWTVKASTDSEISIRVKNANAFGQAIPLTVVVDGPISAPAINWDIKGLEEYWENKFYRK